MVVNHSPSDVGVGRGQRVADLGGQLDDRRGPQPAVEVVVQQHLRRPLGLLPGDGGACTRFGQNGAHAGAILSIEREGLDVRTFTDLDQLAAAVGEELGTSDWIEVDQDRVNLFADATDDHQWIHVDEERAKDGPFGGTIAHGYLTRRLIPALSSTHLQRRDRRAAAQLRAQQGALPQPGQGRRAGPRPRHAGRARPTCRPASSWSSATSIEIEGEAKPACVAETGRPARSADEAGQLRQPLRSAR